ncbi:MAG TPA: hypothetical protein VE621_10305 [Bryobacteraceae bacterium]|nr:hypothetical protein [Bryobacteraceae bacterium]
MNEFAFQPKTPGTAAEPSVAAMHAVIGYLYQHPEAREAVIAILRAQLPPEPRA